MRWFIILSLIGGALFMSLASEAQKHGSPSDGTFGTQIDIQAAHDLKPNGTDDTSAGALSL